MFGEVIAQVSLLCKAMPTHFTHKWLVTGVHFLMYQEVILPLEGLLAVGTHKGSAAVTTSWIPEPIQVAGLPRTLQQMRGDLP